MYKVLTLFLILASAYLTTACSPPNGELNPSFLQYKRDDLGFSIEYPTDWSIEVFNENEIGIKPNDDTNTEIQIGAFPGTPILNTISIDDTIILFEASLQVFVDSLGGTGLTIISNESSTVDSNDWDWIALFYYYYEGLPVRGGYYLKETDLMSYSLIYTSSTQPPEVDKMVNSFTVL
jgi:hypothetical protein